MTTAPTNVNPIEICPACRQRPVRCRGLCKNCRRYVATGALPEYWLAPRLPPGPRPGIGAVPPRAAQPAYGVQGERR
jgi:hypothetical protein